MQESLFNDAFFIPFLLALATAVTGGIGTGVTVLVRKVISHDRQLSLLDTRLESFEAGIMSRHVENRQDMHTIKNELHQLTYHVLQRDVALGLRKVAQSQSAVPPTASPEEL